MRNDSYSADNKGVRHDTGKPEYHLFPADGLRELGRVYTSGAEKYSPYNWERGMAWSRCFNSLLRHLYAFWDGEQNDQESGLNHMAHVVWNAMALLVYSLRSIGIDDRKASYLSAQQGAEEFKWADLGMGDGRATEALNETLKRPVTNHFALAKRIDLEESQASKMRCYNCPNDALPHKTVCAQCFDEALSGIGEMK